LKFCVLFSGQSVQRAGMCRELWTEPAAREILDRLDRVMGGGLEELTTRASDEVLSRTANAQRAIHVHHLGYWFAFLSRHPEVELDGAIGHSVGVVAALVAAGALTVEDSGRFVAARASAFADVCSRLGADHTLFAVATENLDDLLEELPRFPGVTLALRNSRGKGTLGGRRTDLEELAQACRREGWPVRLTPLSVEGPYHTPFFEPCRAPLAAALASIEVLPPRVPVFMGTSGRGESDPSRIRELLAQQPSTCERHLDAVRASYASGCRTYLEVASAPQPIHWLSDQLLDENGAPLPGVKAVAITTENLDSPLL
jgi:[acyl-carrier-protein] S-malonyltransferase